LGIGDWGFEIWDWGLEIGDLRFGILRFEIGDWRLGIGDLGLGIENLGATIEGWQIMKILIIRGRFGNQTLIIDFYSIYQSSICLRLIRCNH
jgi:hypothetical protein